MRETATIAQAFFDAAETVTGIAKVEFITQFTWADLQHVARMPLLLVSPYMMNLTYGRHRQRGSQLLMNTFLITRNRWGERSSDAVLEVMGLLDALDGLIVNNKLGLDIQPFDIHRREAVNIDKGVDNNLSAVRTIYSTLVYDSLDESKFTYLDGNNVLQTVEFTMVSTSFQSEDISDTNDYDWTLDGSMRTYRRTAKKRYELRFTLVPTALKDQLLAMKRVGGQCTYYRNKEADPTMTCYWSNDFNFYEERPGHWTGSVLLHEV